MRILRNAGLLTVFLPGLAAAEPPAESARPVIRPQATPVTLASAPAVAPLAEAVRPAGEDPLGVLGRVVDAGSQHSNLALYQI